MTRNELIAQVRRMYYGGIPTDDATLRAPEVNLYVNEAIAYMARVNYTDSIKIDGIENINDAFYSTFKGLTIAKDNDTGYYYTTLPHPPLGLSRGYGIATVTFPVSTGLSKAPIAISPRELDYIDQIKLPPSKIFYWCEGDKLYFKSYINLLTKNPIVRMISVENTDLDAELNVPPEYIPDMFSWIMGQLNARRQMIGDSVKDGLDTGKL